MTQLVRQCICQILKTSVATHFKCGNACSYILSLYFSFVYSARIANAGLLYSPITDNVQAISHSGYAKWTNRIQNDSREDMGQAKRSTKGGIQVRGIQVRKKNDGRGENGKLEIKERGGHTCLDVPAPFSRVNSAAL